MGFRVLSWMYIALSFFYKAISTPSLFSLSLASCLRKLLEIEEMDGLEYVDGGKAEEEM